MPGIPLTYLHADTVVREIDLHLLEELEKTASLSREKHAASFSKKNILMGAIGLSLILLLVFILKFSLFSASEQLVYLKQIHPDFVGRKEYLAALKKICIKEKKTQIPVAILWGEGGVGKSEIAATFANQQLKYFELVYWLDCATEESYSASYFHLARQLNIHVDQKESFLETVRKVHHYLENEITHQPWLLIFDNAEKEFELPQRGEGAIIITTRNQIPWHLYTSLEVYAFNDEEACSLLEKITREKESPHRFALIKELDSFPLALNLVAHYIAETPGMTEEEYLKLLTQNKIDLIETMPADSRYPTNLLNTWEIAAGKLHEKHPDALHWLQFCSYLCPHGIPWVWIEAWINQQKPDENVFLKKMMVNDLLRVLVNQSLVHYEKATKNLSVHRLKQEIFRRSKYCNPEVKEEVLEFLTRQTEGLERIEEVERNLGSWTNLRDWEIHASWFLTYHAEGAINEKIAHLQNVLGCWKCVKGEYQNAKVHFEEALKIKTQLFGEEDSHLITSMNNLGWIFWKLGEFNESKKLYQQALALCQRFYGIEHPELAATMNNLTLVLRDVGEYDSMRSLNEAALEMRIKMYGEMNSYVADSMHNLAWTLWKLSAYEEAQHLYEKSWEIYQTLHGKEHPYVAITMHNLGRVFVSQGKYQEAEKLYEQALKLYAKLYGKNHPYLAICMQCLGQAVEKQGKYCDALKCFHQAFLILSHAYSKDHPNLIQGVEDLLRLLQQPENRHLVNKTVEEIYPICLRIFGDNHPFIEAFVTLGEADHEFKRFIMKEWY